MNNNQSLIILGIIILIFVVKEKQNVDSDLLIKCVYAMLICGILYNLQQNGNLVNNTGKLQENLETGNNNQNDEPNDDQEDALITDEDPDFDVKQPSEQDRTTDTGLNNNNVFMISDTGIGMNKSTLMNDLGTITKKK